jgi:lipoprotein-anchoring transpeptidase ErfK/SrfK
VDNKKKLHIIIIILSVIFVSVEAAGHYLGTRDVAFGNDGDLRRERDKTGIHAPKVRNATLRQRLRGLTPNEIYIVIDTGRNILYLKKGKRNILETSISSGSGSILKDPSGNRQWIFDTPRGEYHVKTKYVSPAWIKPDWAFIEEGEAIPKDPRKRVEESVLGAYALGFGNGYFIHGTLYTRLLGRNVTHGCVRVGDEDLKVLYYTAGVGTRIYIF